MDEVLVLSDLKKHGWLADGLGQPRVTLYKEETGRSAVILMTKSEDESIGLKYKLSLWQYSMKVRVMSFVHLSNAAQAGLDWCEGKPMP